METRAVGHSFLKGDERAKCRAEDPGQINTELDMMREQAATEGLRNEGGGICFLGLPQGNPARLTRLSRQAPACGSGGRKSVIQV